MLLSIMIPTYNGEKYISECLESCLNQDISASDYEIYCIDDGSTDRTMEILKDFASRYSNVVADSKQHGVGNPRNVGLERVSGDYVWFVDQDDIIRSHCLRTLLDTIIEKRCDRLYFGYYEFVEQLNSKEKELIAKNKLKSNGIGNIDNVVWTSVFSRQFLLDNDVWPKSKRLGNKKGGYGVDSFFIQECKAANAREMFLNDGPFYYYRKHSGQSVYDYSDKTCEFRVISYLDYPMMFKEEYDAAVAKKGVAEFPETRDLVVQVRGCALKMQALPRKWTKDGMDRMREEGLFPLPLPKIYTDNYSWRDCVKAKNGMGPLCSIAFYYSVNPIGVFFYNILSFSHASDILKSRSKVFRNMILLRLKLMNYLRGKRQS